MTDNKAAASNDHGGEHAHHPSLKMYFGVFFALIALTWITVATAQLDFGDLNIWIAMAIATVKGSLVVLFFMHIAFDKPINAVVLVISLLFLSLFIAFAMIDTVQYQHQIDKDPAPKWQKAVEATGATPK